MKNKFPRISRIITDRELYSVILASIIMIFALIVVGIDLSHNYHKASVARSIRSSLITQKDAWSKILIRYPDYRDGFLALAIIEYRLGEKYKASQLLNKSLQIDPNYSDGLKFEEYLKKN